MFKIKTCESGNKPVDVLETVCESLWSSGNLSIFISSSVNLIHQFYCYYNEIQGKTEHEFSRNLTKTAIPAQVKQSLSMIASVLWCTLYLTLWQQGSSPFTALKFIGDYDVFSFSIQNLPGETNSNKHCLNINIHPEFLKSFFWNRTQTVKLN